MHRLLIYISAFIVTAASAVSCIDDSFTFSPSDQPVFSVDTLHLGVVFTEQMTVTHRFVVTNRADKSLSISSISLSGDGAPYFRINVDGFSGREFRDVEIRAKDSIFVFVEATLPPSCSDIPVKMCADVDFITNGVKSSVVLSALGQDVIRLDGLVVDAGLCLDSPRPYQVFDSLVVAPGAVLTLAEGVRLMFHDGAYLAVDGTLIARGTPSRPVILSGDRTGNVVSDISFDLMSRQWPGAIFRATSRGNILSHTIIKNTVAGVIVDGSDESVPDRPTLSLLNCRLRNSGGHVLEAFHADIDAVGCEFAEGGGGLVLLHGGRHSFNHCTFANYYLFSAIGGAAIDLSHVDGKTDDLSPFPYTAAVIDNSIVYGLGRDISHGDLTGMDIYLRNTLLRSAGTDDDNFISCIWDQDPLYYTVRADYLFDYRLRDGSPAVGAADPSLTAPSAVLDAYGLPRGAQPDLGAYVYCPSDD